MAATALPYNPRYCFAPVEDTEAGVQQTRIFVEGIAIAIGTSLVALTRQTARPAGAPSGSGRKRQGYSRRSPGPGTRDRCFLGTSHSIGSTLSGAPSAMRRLCSRS